jgi:hypothetical protein
VRKRERNRRKRMKEKEGRTEGRRETERREAGYIYCISGKFYRKF